MKTDIYKNKVRAMDNLNRRAPRIDRYGSRICSTYFSEFLYMMYKKDVHYGIYGHFEFEAKKMGDSFEVFDPALIPFAIENL